MSASNAGRVGVWGASGSGKSSYTKKRLAPVRRIVVFDPMDEYAAQGMTRARTAAEVAQAILADPGGFRVAYVPPAGKEARALSQLCRLLMRVQEPFRAGRHKAQLTLVVEEMNLSFPVAGGAEKCPGFADVCSRGRHFGIEVYGLSQRIAEVSTRFRGNCTETVVLRQQGPRDVKAAADALGCDPGRVKALANLQYLHERSGRITAAKVTF